MTEYLPSKHQASGHQLIMVGRHGAVCLVSSRTIWYK